MFVNLRGYDNEDFQKALENVIRLQLKILLQGPAGCTERYRGSLLPDSNGEREMEFGCLLMNRLEFSDHAPPREVDPCVDPNGHLTEFLKNNVQRYVHTAENEVILSRGRLSGAGYVFYTRLEAMTLSKQQPARGSSIQRR